MDKFSESLQIEYADKGIIVQVNFYIKVIFLFLHCFARGPVRIISF